MRAMIIEEFGPSSVFKEAEIPTPTIADHEVLIQVHASSVNPVDWKIRSGFVPAFCPTFPAVLHPDCAGVVAQVGSNAKTRGLKEGDEVFAFAGGLVGKQGALAEFMPADARMVAQKPKTLSLESAATLPLVAVTSWTALIDRTPIEPGSSILIQGGTGGVGFLALQLAREKFGEHVYVTCGSPEKCALAESLGAKKALNYNNVTGEDLYNMAPNGAGFDVVFNTVGAPAINTCVTAARYAGTIIDINGAFPTDGPFQFKALGFLSVFGGYGMTHGFGQSRVGEILEELTSLVDADAIKPLVDQQRFTFAEVSEAHDHLENGKPTGKVALSSHWI